MMLARRCSLLAHALSTASVPTKKNRSFSTVSKWPPNLKQKHPKCSLSNHRVRWHPWSTIIFWYAKKKNQYVWPLDAFPVDPTPFKIVVTYQKNFTLGPADPTRVPEEKKKTWAQKRTDLHGMRSYVKLKTFQVGTPSSPYSKKRDSRTF